MEEQIPAIDYDNSILEVHCQNFLEKSALDLTSTDEYPAIVAELGDTSRKHKQVITRVHDCQRTLSDMKFGIKEELRE